MSRMLNRSSLIQVPVTQAPLMTAARGTSLHHGLRFRIISRTISPITAPSIVQSTQYRCRRQRRPSLRSKLASELTIQIMAGQTAVSSFVKDSGCGSAPPVVFHSEGDASQLQAV